MTRMDGTDVEYNDALLKVIHDEEPKGVPMGVDIRVSIHLFSIRLSSSTENLSINKFCEMTEKCGVIDFNKISGLVRLRL